MAKTVVVLGARNLGGAIVDYFLTRWWSRPPVIAGFRRDRGPRRRRVVPVRPRPLAPSAVRATLVSRQNVRFTPLDPVSRATGAPTTIDVRCAPDPLIRPATGALTTLDVHQTPHQQLV